MSARAVLTELLRLYDWRFELAEMEKAADSLPHAYSAEIAEANAAKRTEVKRLLAQYGREKKAAWEAARRVLSVSSAGPTSPDPQVLQQARDIHASYLEQREYVNDRAATSAEIVLARELIRIAGSVASASEARLESRLLSMIYEARGMYPGCAVAINAIAEYAKRLFARTDGT